MSTVGPYSPRDYRRVCDICGVLYNRSALVKRDDGLFYCPDDTGGLTARGKDRLNALQSSGRKKVRTESKPRSELPTYEAEEARVFNLITSDVYPYRYKDVTSGMPTTLVDAVPNVLALATSVKYLYDLYAENKRPQRWRDIALDKIARNADRLLTFQYGSDEGYAAAYGTFQYGLVTATAGIGSTNATCHSMLAFIYAYRLIGATKYIRAARRCATLLRRMQRCDALTTGAAAGRTNFWPSGTLDGGLSWITDNRLIPENITGIWALKELQTTDGDSSYGDDSVTSGFSSPSGSVPLSTMISDARAFWTSFQGICGLSSATPKIQFDQGNDFTWDEEIFTGVDAIPVKLVYPPRYCEALQALYSLEGYSSQVADVYTWLLSFTTNPSASLPSTLSPSQIAVDVRGTYDPTITMANIAQYDSNGTRVTYNWFDTTTNMSIYSWQCAGMLAAIHSARNPSYLRKAKDAIAQFVHRYDDGNPTNSNILDDIQLLGISGFGYQTGHPNLILRVWDSVAAARFANIYRHNPRVWPVQDTVS